MTPTAAPPLRPDCPRLHSPDRPNSRSSRPGCCGSRADRPSPGTDRPACLPYRPGRAAPCLGSPHRHNSPSGRPCCCGFLPCLPLPGRAAPCPRPPGRLTPGPTGPVAASGPAAPVLGLIAPPAYPAAPAGLPPASTHPTDATPVPAGQVAAASGPAAPLALLRAARHDRAGTVCLVAPPGASPACYDLLPPAYPGPQELLLLTTPLTDTAPLTDAASAGPASVARTRSSPLWPGAVRPPSRCCSPGSPGPVAWRVRLPGGWG